MTTDYTAQATDYVASGDVTELDVKGWTDPDNGKPWRGYRVFVADLNASVDLGAYDEDHARAKATEHFAGQLQQRDPAYVAPQPPSVADNVLAALDSIDTATATIDDVVATVKDSLITSGAQPAA